MRFTACFAAAALATSALALPQQIPFGQPSSSLLLSPTLHHPAFSSFAPTLAQLPKQHFSKLEQHVAAYPDRRTLVVLQTGERLEVSEGEKALLVLQGLKFVDVTDDVEGAVAVYSKGSYPSKLSHNATQLEPLFKHISIKKMKAFISKFSDFYNRYYRSSYGRQSQQWLLEHLQSLHKELNPSANITFTEFKHSTWDQRTIILHWAPSAASNASDSVVIAGAHQDSTNSLPFLRAPGADDDGSGTTALVQILTSLLAAGWAPTECAVEFHWYSAEEGGLLGSGEVARSYVREGKKVKAMWHSDVVAYVKPGTTPVVGLITDNADPDLVDFMKLVINEYAEIPYAESQTHYPASDYGSWFKNGYPAVCTAEGKFEDSNPNMHSANDVWDRPEYSFEHIAQFVRVGLGYLVELGGFEEVKK
ncbi:hypothetical protein JCM8097_008945 [Rhodosporidiobolus ruineniae]